MGQVQARRARRANVARIAAGLNRAHFARALLERACGLSFRASQAQLTQVPTGIPLQRHALYFDSGVRRPGVSRA